jgi:hypothetical protein
MQGTGARPRATPENQPLVEWLSFLALRYVAGVTLLVAPASYDAAQRKHAEKSFSAHFMEG